MTTLPWVEKYRPKNVNEVAYQEEVVNTLTRALESANLPHLLFYGPPGTGKTSTALAIARQLYGPELMKSRVMELNASDERGIHVVREKVKSFAAAAVGAPAAGYPCPPYKLLILDEADSMTQDAQNALRRTMETYSRVTRFVFICNYVSRIIEPLASRCAKFRFKPLQPAVMAGRIEHICEREGVTLAPGALETLSEISGGDLRRAITTLQSASRLGGGTVDRTILLDVSGRVPEEVVSGLAAACKAPGAFAGLQRRVSGIVAEGFAAQQVLQQLQSELLCDTSKPDLQLVDALEALAAADFSLTVGADETIQLLNVVGQVHKAYQAA
ncbi:Subunit of heteropentameric Replication factor C (RF-C) [Pleodorina starrii]|uniref:Subunit of heteropentameric Replication factor C (RF-C) n=1 Tax=Pleodorina starrii TaxID=330485 RepID=A0A9W6F5I1_9CHLO|nr:Subunit of heteropentameric Replication factor C (RF-C) [Pleodorina starrii]GLC57237.1 Subunit of heteropentameric Replication factor C (RF-C) [Pleodorina starrii]GLC71372.1 Subunit of heteropentameric Replication factor C (RF-C) [Pleodorina starrii]